MYLIIFQIDVLEVPTISQGLRSQGEPLTLARVIAAVTGGQSGPGQPAIPIATPPAGRCSQSKWPVVVHLVGGAEHSEAKHSAAMLLAYM